MKRLCCSLILLILVFAFDVFSKEWNGIIPGVSTRLDIERMLGKEDLSESTIAIYKYKKSRVFVDYERKDEKDFNKDVVIRLRVLTNKSETLASYTRRIPDFHRNFLKSEVPDEISHINGLAYYRNSAEGFEIEVQKNEKGIEVVHALGYFAPN